LRGDANDPYAGVTMHGNGASSNSSCTGCTALPRDKVPARNNYHHQSFFY
jgi:hypothetical protein